jgi:hypothetical protein
MRHVCNFVFYCFYGMLPIVLRPALFYFACHLLAHASQVDSAKPLFGIVSNVFNGLMISFV